MMPVLGMMVHACNSSTWEVEAMSWAWGQPASHEKMSEKKQLWAAEAAQPDTTKPDDLS